MEIQGIGLALQKLNSFLGGNKINNSQCIFNFDFFRRKGGYEKVERSGLEEFDKRKGHIIFNELKMGGKDRKFVTYYIMVYYTCR